MKERKQTYGEDIIAAIATPRGKGAISCIRISGQGSAALVQKLTGVPFSDGGEKIYHARMVPCTFVGRVRDRIMAVVYYGNRSYTGEESAELYFHGGIFMTEQALCGVLDAGARLADAGEFTRRAFLNGKIDLTQAEGIGDLIDAENMDALDAAYEQSEGKIRQSIDALYDKTAEVAARAEVCIDYPEEDLEESETPALAHDIERLRTDIAEQLSAYGSGRIRRQGARVVLAGETNAGKSTLFNALLGDDRAIVSDEAGTTRDTVEEKLRIGEQACVLVDTAGLRETENKVEQMGIARTRAALSSADIVLYVLRGDAPLPVADDKTVCVRNCEGALFDEGADIAVNAKSGEGIEKLRDLLAARIRALSPRAYGINNPRQYAALSDADAALSRALAALDTLTLDCVCADLRDALDCLGAVNGRRADEAILRDIFANFCVGK